MTSIEDVFMQHQVEREFRQCIGHCGRRMFERKKYHVSELTEICVDGSHDFKHYLCTQCFKETIFDGKCCLCGIMFKDGKTTRTNDLGGITYINDKQYCSHCLSYKLLDDKCKYGSKISNERLMITKHTLLESMHNYVLIGFICGMRGEKTMSSVKEIVEFATHISMRKSSILKNDMVKKIFKNLIQYVDNMSISNALDIIETLPEESIPEMTLWFSSNWHTYIQNMKSK